MGSPSLLARFRSTSADPELAHDVLRQTYADFTVRVSGSTENFQFGHAGAVAPEWTMARTRYSMRAEMDTETPLGSIIVGTIVSGQLSVEAGLDRVIAAPASPTLLAPDQPRWWVRIDDLLLDAVTLDRAVLHRQASLLFGLAEGRLRFDGMTPLSPALGQHWQNVAANIGRSMLDEELAANSLVVAEAGHRLAAATLLTFPNSGLTLLDCSRQPDVAAPAVLRRAMAYIDEHAAEPVCVGDVAAAARISVRGLQYVFQRERGISPLGHLRRVRLEGAHRDLVAADPTGGDTVARIAARWGFSHAGRFSTEYREAYRCSPSRTLRS